MTVPKNLLKDYWMEAYQGYGGCLHRARAKPLPRGTKRRVANSFLTRPRAVQNNTEATPERMGGCFDV